MNLTFKINIQGFLCVVFKRTHNVLDKKCKCPDNNIWDIFLQLKATLFIYRMDTLK